MMALCGLVRVEQCLSVVVACFAVCGWLSVRFSAFSELWVVWCVCVRGVGDVCVGKVCHCCLVHYMGGHGIRRYELV